MKKLLINSYYYFKHIRNNIKNKNVDNYIRLIISSIVLFPLINGFISIIIQIVKNGFVKVIDLTILKLYFNRFSLGIELILLILLLFLMIFTKIKSSKKERILVIISSIFGLFSFILIDAITSSRTVSNLYMIIIKILAFNSLKILPFALIIYLLIAIFCLFKLINHIYNEFYNEVSDIVHSLVLSLIIMPFIIFILTNILPICTGLIYLIIAIVILSIVCVSNYILDLLFGGSFMDFSSNTGYVNETKENDNKKDKKIIKEYNCDTKFYRKDGVFGQVIIQENFYGNSIVCSAKEFDSGKVIIKYKGKVVNSILKITK